jgi:hypothetical protein
MLLPAQNVFAIKNLFFTPPRMAAFLYNFLYVSMSYNVPAVYDFLPARIRALRSKDQGWQNVAEFWRGNERSD